MNFLKIKNKPVNWKRKFDLPVAWACMYTVLRIEVSIKQNISAIAIKMNVFYLVGLYLAISAVITQRSQCVFFLFSFSVLRCRSCLGLDLRCVVWCRGLRGYFWLLHRFLFRIFGTLCYLHKYYEAKKAIESKKSHYYSVNGIYENCDGCNEWLLH